MTLKNILIVEDESVLRATFVRFLKEEGYSAIGVADYDAALLTLNERDYDVVVSDIVLSGPSGIDLLHFVAEHEPKTMVVLITGQPEVATAAEAVRAGAFDYIPKPVTRDDLQNVVRLALDKKRILEERDQYAAQMERLRKDLKAVFDSVGDGLIMVDANASIHRLNPAAAEILGRSTDELVGRAIYDCLGRDFAEVNSAVERCLQEFTPSDENRIHFHVPHDGYRTAVASVVPLTPEGGNEGGVLLTLRDITSLTRLENEVETKRHGNIIGKSRRMTELYRLVRDLADTDSTVLICGESGTGKEIFAEAIHAASDRRDEPFVRVNCAALSEGLLESELFGHVRGAFTGAVRDRVGRFEAADKGTILLDEIGDISPGLQLKLLRVLQEREFERVGDATPVPADVRVIASTNQELREKIGRGEFREDLYYRLNVIRIDIPPLRERREDIPLLVEHFRHHFNRRLRREVRTFSASVMELFMRYDWPGNVRELENVLERAFIVCRDTEVQLSHLPEEITAHTSGEMVGGGRGQGANGDLSRDEIVDVLEKTDWNVAKSARILGVARNTLYQKMKSYAISRPGG